MIKNEKTDCYRHLITNYKKFTCQQTFNEGPLWPWTHGSWIYNYLCNQCISSLMLWVRISIRARWTTFNICATDLWFSSGPPGSSTNKTDSHDIAKILLKVALNKQTLIESVKETIFVFTTFNTYFNIEY